MPAFADPNSLKQFLLFQDLTGEQLTQVNALLRRKTFAAGASIMTMEQHGEVAYIVISGTVKIYAEGSEGADVILAILGAGEVVGEMSLVDSLGRSATVVALEETTLCWIDRTAFWHCLKTMPEMTFNLARILSRRVRLADSQIRALSTLDVHGRIARQLLAFAREYGENVGDGAVFIPVRLTQSDLAGLVGASRVRVNQVLVYWKRRKYISVDDRHHTTILNSAALAKRCQ